MDCLPSLGLLHSTTNLPFAISLDEELVEMPLEVDHLFTEYEQKVKWETGIDLDEETPNNGARFSICG